MSDSSKKENDSIRIYSVGQENRFFPSLLETECVTLQTDRNGSVCHCIKRRCCAKCKCSPLQVCENLGSNPTRNILSRKQLAYVALPESEKNRLRHSGTRKVEIQAE